MSASKNSRRVTRNIRDTIRMAVLGMRLAEDVMATAHLAYALRLLTTTRQSLTSYSARVAIA